MTKRTIKLGNTEGQPSKMSRIRGEMRQFFSGLSGEERAMLEGEISGQGLGLFEGFFYGNDQDVSYALKQLSIKYHGKFDEVANRLRNFLATVECVDLSKRALFLDELQDHTAEEPKTEELVREAVTDAIERTQVQVRVDGASPMETTQATQLPKTTIKMNVPQSASEPADQLEATASQPQDPVVVGFSAKAIEGRPMKASPWAGKLPVKLPDVSAKQSVEITHKPGTAAFSEKGKIRGREMTVGPWQLEIGAQIFEDVTPFFDSTIKTPEDEKVLAAVLNIKNPNDLKEMHRLIREHARPDDKDAFMRMNNSIELFIKRLGRPAEDVRKALTIKLEGGHILPVTPRKPGINPRDQLTIPSANRRRGGKRKK